MNLYKKKKKFKLFNISVLHIFKGYNIYDNNINMILYKLLGRVS